MDGTSDRLKRELSELALCIGGTGRGQGAGGRRWEAGGGRQEQEAGGRGREASV